MFLLRYSATVVTGYNDKWEAVCAFNVRVANKGCLTVFFGREQYFPTVGAAVASIDASLLSADLSLMACFAKFEALHERR